MSKKHVHIFGASGSGTTSIGKRLCDLLDYRHFDTDDYFWLPTEDPFTEIRPEDERIRLLERALSGSEQWVLSGSLTGWGDVFIPRFDLVIFVSVPNTVRMERLQKREYKRYGAAVLPGGSRYESTGDFLEWAAAYDTSARDGRSLARHEAWLSGLPCAVLRIVNDDFNKSVKAALKAIRQ